MSKKVNPAMPALFSELRKRLASTAARVEEAAGYLETEGQYSAIGTIAGIEEDLADIAALYGATMAIHRSSHGGG